MCDPDQDVSGPLPLVADVNTRHLDCTECGHSGSVLEAAFTVTTTRGVHQVGMFAFCFACENTPGGQPCATRPTS
ncbi:hypothetical protein QFZ43_005496 [Streptomyces afghaniensis]|nr:hypothetical protein [Streptomyces afghaniensis]